MPIVAVDMGLDISEVLLTLLNPTLVREILDTIPVNDGLDKGAIALM